MFERGERREMCCERPARVWPFDGRVRLALSVVSTITECEAFQIGERMSDMLEDVGFDVADALKNKDLQSVGTESSSLSNPEDAIPHQTFARVPRE